jgi:hypothetical protein
MINLKIEYGYKKIEINKDITHLELFNKCINNITPLNQLTNLTHLELHSN